MKNTLTKDLMKNLKAINGVLNTDKSFDLICRMLEIGERQAAIFFVDGFCKDEVLEKILEFLYGIDKKDMPDTAEEMSKGFVPYNEVNLENDIEKIVTGILSGVTVLIIDGFEKAIFIDLRTYPTRGVEEPEKEKVLRGSKDGFVETIVFNTALIRRRIRNPQLVMEYTSVGKSSKTDVVFCYMENRVDKKFLEKIRARVNKIQVDAINMTSESLAECLQTGSWWNPFPKFKYTERPDSAASSVLEGNIIILIDNSPSAMILPTTLFEITEEADDYYFPPITGTYLRITRAAINIIALFLTPIWLLLMNNQTFIPSWLEFIVVKETINIPLPIQLLILEFAVDGLKMASINTPSMLSTPLSVVAAIVLGDFTVSSGWFNSETMLYMAFVVIANYTQSSYELGYALKFLRLIMIVLTGLFNIWGFGIGVAITFIAILSNKTLSGKSYFYPVIPFNGKELFRRIFRISLPAATKENK